MATLKTLRPLSRTLKSPLQQQRRTFLPFPIPSTLLNASSNAPQTLTASRTLPYASAPIYSIISDVASYSAFLPYCESSRVTQLSNPDAKYNRVWPSEGKITVGFKGLSEEFSSRVYCVPGSIVESVGGSTATSLPKEDIAHHFTSSDPQQSRSQEAGGLLSHLRSRWTVEPRGRESTQVTLALEFAFTNPLYAALSAGAAPKVADMMVKAFEERVMDVLERDPRMKEAALEEMEGSRMKR